MDLSVSPKRPACPSRASGWSTLTTSWGLPCCVRFPCVHAVATTPAQRLGGLSRSLSQPCQPSPKGLSGRPAHRPFRGLLGVHSRYGLHTRAATNSWHAFRRLQLFRHLHSCSGCFRLERLPGGACTHWKAPPSHGAHPEETCARRSSAADSAHPVRYPVKRGRGGEASRQKAVVRSRLVIPVIGVSNDISPVIRNLLSSASDDNACASRRSTPSATQCDLPGRARAACPRWCNPAVLRDGHYKLCKYQLQFGRGGGDGRRYQDQI